MHGFRPGWKKSYSGIRYPVNETKISEVEIRIKLFGD
jgi:hypothetical protein